MTELIKKSLHMNRQKGKAVTQLTLDEDFIVPDVLDDVARVLLADGEIRMEDASAREEKVPLRGKLVFRILYRKPDGGLQALGGEIPFEDTLNVPEAEETDVIQASGMLEDLSADLINSRKLSIRAVLTLEVRPEGTEETEAAVDLKTDEPGFQLLREEAEIASVAVRRKESWRLCETVSLSGSRPGIGKLLWDEMRFRGVSVQPAKGAVRLDGELVIFLIYEAEEEKLPIQWLEESIPFSGEIEIPEAEEEMIPAAAFRPGHREIEVKPDEDGEMRCFEAEAVLELDLKLYREEKVQLLRDVCAAGCEVITETGEVCFDRLLTRNHVRTRISEQIRLREPERILQICHSSGQVRADRMEPRDNGLYLEGVLELTLLYLTDDDAEPIRAAQETIPFECTAEADGIGPDSIWQAEVNPEQLTAVMQGGDTAEIRAVIGTDLLVLQPARETVAVGIRTEPRDRKKLEQLPGIAGYVVQPGETLWEIAKKFHLTVDQIKETNGLSDDKIKPPERLILIKDIQ